MVALTPPHLLTLKHASAGRGPAERRREHERVREYERRRLGADLHDNLGQHLTGLACLAAALREELRRAGSALAAQADQLARAAATAHEVTRRLAHGLCPPQLGPTGLRAALEDLGDSVRRLHPVTCIFEPKGPPGREAPDTAAQVFCIAQEAIANAIRHFGHARKIVIRLRAPDGPSLRLAIEDDGTGFDPATLRRERAASAGS